MSLTFLKSGHIYFFVRIVPFGLTENGDLPPVALAVTCCHLTDLYLQENSLSGLLSSLSDLSNLQTAYFGRNNFTSVPSAVFSGLTSLQKLSLFNNPSLSPCPFSTDLTQSSTLSDLDFGSAGIIGDLPDIFDSFPSLQNLRLSYNNLTEALPKSLASSSIINLWLNNQQNGLSGTIEVHSNMTQLSQLWLHKNQFTGGIPDLSKCDSLIDGASKLEEHTPGPCDDKVMVLLKVAEGFGYPSRFAELWKGNDPCT
ncbi:hypothetical protein Ahy_B05g074538 [Arachis hypogaea]|uniref:Leucine-rich repeat-containing N-terminal plant-type domain-containing protein n=1 Tax=Arachis hypogaea TaxID=3818 RepID=A0A444YZH4_ARAHY|nr:hypothetical protein Ahy_B05g074538 [Arachis hypogaea]